MTTLTRSHEPPHLRAPVRLDIASAALWRVIADGRVIGHLQEIVTDSGIRYRARRYHPTTRAFRDLGDFWSADEAVDCLRLGR